MSTDISSLRAPSSLALARAAAVTAFTGTMLPRILEQPGNAIRRVLDVIRGSSSSTCKATAYGLFGNSAICVACQSLMVRLRRAASFFHGPALAVHASVSASHFNVCRNTYSCIPSCSPVTIIYSPSSTSFSIARARFSANRDELYPNETSSLLAALKSSFAASLPCWTRSVLCVDTE